ncbi:hypothetical protein FS837_011376 [Tulasnella sp. UAMH 9824]|nr:hypothetical protein FS837_011376 [Tulasnella sp. UAMH 9824]
MPAASQNLINNVTELILNHILQTSQECHGAPNPDKLDENEFQEIDGEINDIKEIFASLQTSLKSLIMQLKKQRNNHIHFHQLPPEIVSNILWLSIADPWKGRKSYSFLRRQNTISLVCLSWRTLVKESPRFWSIIEFSCSQWGISHLLKKSQGSSLEIKCFSDRKYSCEPPDFFRPAVDDEYISLIAPHIGRIRSLILSRSTDELVSVLGSPAPMLQELRLTSVHGFFPEPLDLFCGQAGRLRDVALEYIPVRWDSGVFVGLRSLKIKGNSHRSLTAGQVRRLLKANSGLEEMIIEDVTIAERFRDDAVKWTSGGKPTRVVMSKMQELRLIDLPFELVRAVLGDLEIPTIRHLELRCLLQGQPASRILGSKIDHLVSPLLQGSKGAHQAEMTLGISSLGLAIYLPGDESPTIRIELKHTVPASGFEWLAENFFGASGLPSVGGEEVFQVSLKFGQSFDMTGSTFIPILDRLSAVKVKDLTIEDGCRNGAALLKYLGKLKADSEWPLPHLTSLTIGGPPEMAAPLLHSLQSRKHDAPTNKTATAPRPATLWYLDIGGLRGVERKMEKALYKCISSDGTLIRGRSRVLTSRRDSDDDLEDFDDDSENFDDDD